MEDYVEMPDELFGPNAETLLVLGNGFDLNLGYKTAYSDFCSPDNDLPYDGGGFPFIRNAYDFHDLGNFILRKTGIEKWYDLENILAEYGELRKDSYQGIVSSVQLRNDEADYNMLVNALRMYLENQDYSNPLKNSVAARVLKAAYSGLVAAKVYSFNYTDLAQIGAALGIEGCNAIHIHGNLQGKDIILGVGDYAHLPKGLSFMYKTDNVEYKNTQFLNDLKNCKRIVIFGLSLSQVDYPYFEDLFKILANGESDKYVRIITHDDAARRDILFNLRGMNSGMIKLKNYCNIDVIRTKDNVDEDKVIELLSVLNPAWEIDV